MKRLSLGIAVAAALGFVAGPVSAADLPKAPPVVMPTLYNWSGVCIGVEAGFNWQVPGSRWVFGIEGDGQWAELEGALTCAAPALTSLTCGTKIRDFETVRARIGYAFGPRGDFLAYVTGGWAT